VRKVGDTDRGRTFLWGDKGYWELGFGDTAALIKEAGFEAVFYATVAAESEVVRLIGGYRFEGEGWRKRNTGFEGGGG
jgi:hypothetical protein